MTSQSAQPSLPLQTLPRATRSQALRATLTAYAPSLLTADAVAAAATGILALAGWLAGAAHAGPPWLAEALALAAVAIGGSLILVGAVRGIWARQLNVDELVAIALVASVLAGETLSGALVAFMMLAGKVVEDVTAARAERALQRLGRLLPAMARRLDDAGTERVVPLEDLRQGDVVVVRPGERLPVDGVVVRGQAAVDQAPITGESLPTAKEAGHEVYAGSLVSEGALAVRTTAVGAATTLGRIGSSVTATLAERAPIVRVADRYARYFTPLILALAGITYVATGHASAAVAVLVAACPCALVLATPTAIVAGVAAGARRGLLVRGGARLEAAGRVDTVCFDKTGTLTLGIPHVERVVTFAGMAEGELLALAASAERYSEHPIARAVLAHAALSGIRPDLTSELDSFRSYPGLGVTALVGGNSVAVGTARLMSRLGLDVAAATAGGGVGELGETALYVSVGTAIVGAMALVDTPRPEAREAVRALRQAGVRRIVILTGDNQRAAAAVAAAVGIDEVHAGLLPDEKVEWVRRLRASGLRVAMVGDGVNDAPALAAADTAIVMGAAGTDVALEAADIALVTDELPRAAEAILLGRQTLRLIYQNLAFALLWNVIAIAAAGTGLLPPAGAALVHNIGSIAVVGNAARMAGWRPHLPGRHRALPVLPPRRR
ncbi:MAG: heavy metal translocating P-type ATPase [Anaerolineae bacterium]